MSKFTEGQMETGGTPGQTSQVKSMKTPDGTMLSPYPMDNVHGVNLPNTMGKDLAKSCTDISHSLTGSSAVQRQARATRFKE